MKIDRYAIGSIHWYDDRQWRVRRVAEPKGSPNFRLISFVLAGRMQGLFGPAPEVLLTEEWADEETLPVLTKKV